jgi:hypothetical protein
LATAEGAPANTAAAATSATVATATIRRHALPAGPEVPDLVPCAMSSPDGRAGRTQRLLTGPRRPLLCKAEPDLFPMPSLLRNRRPPGDVQPSTPPSSPPRARNRWLSLGGEPAGQLQ